MVSCVKRKYIGGWWLCGFAGNGSESVYKCLICLFFETCFSIFVELSDDDNIKLCGSVKKAA